MKTDDYLICSECHHEVNGSLEELQQHYEQNHPEFIKILHLQQKMFLEEKPAMIVPFNKIQSQDDLTSLYLISIHTNVWIDGNLEAIVIEMPDDKAELTQFLLDIPTAGYINLR